MSKYLDIYNYIKKEIISGQIGYGGRLPSVRKASELFSVSRTSVQNAYFALAADGFIISEPQSGYYVSYRTPKKDEKKEQEKDNNRIRYNFTSSAADGESFDFDIWRRHIKAALRLDSRLLSYSEPQGEYELRMAISEYIRDKRNVTASADRIVIGAGVQSLLHILCSLIGGNKTVSFPDRSFVQGASLFTDYGFDVRYRHKDADIIYVSPSHMTRWGDVMPNKRRVELVKYSAKKESLVIEDDYESDFQYNSKPTPSLYALSGGNNVVYIGSFSKLLLPSIRISFMVLTQELADKYKNNIYKFSQTASKTEQLALCSFIRDGNLKAQIRKTRRFYTAKNKRFYNMLKKSFPNADIEISENLLQVIITTDFFKPENIFDEYGVKVFIEKRDENKITLVLNPGSIPEKELENSVNVLKKAIEN